MVLAVGIAASVDDLSRGKIANWIPAAALAGGFGWQIGQGGWHGALAALGGTTAGFAVFLVFYLLGGMGAGDVKLMAGFGALLGVPRIMGALLWAFAIGGVFVTLIIAWCALRRTPRPKNMPYAPAIALGVLISLLG